MVATITLTLFTKEHDPVGCESGEQSTPESEARAKSCSKGQELKVHLKVVFGSLQTKEAYSCLL